MTKDVKMNLKLMTETELSEAISISVATLRNWRLNGKGPPYHKINKLVRYDLTTVHKYLASTEKDSADLAV